MPYFLCFTKSRRKKSPQGGGEAAERQKDLIGFVRSFCLCALIRGLQNLESHFGKVLILFVRSRHCSELNRGSQNLDVLCKENEFILFACTKRTKSTPEVCEPLDSGDDSSSVGEGLAKLSSDTNRNRLFAQNGGEKALNRCEVRALQRKDLERTTKE